jgi:hypothetical protein
MFIKFIDLMGQKYRQGKGQEIVYFTMSSASLKMMQSLEGLTGEDYNQLKAVHSHQVVSSGCHLKHEDHTQASYCGLAPSPQGD